MIHATERISGRPVPYEIVGRRPGDPVATFADPTRSADVLGWRATRTLEDIIASAWAWHHAHPDGYRDAGVAAAPTPSTAGTPASCSPTARPCSCERCVRPMHQRWTRSTAARRPRATTGASSRAKPTLSPSELRHFTDVDMVGRAALCVEWHGEFIAWASYERWPGRDDADTAFMVDAGHQGKGIATLLLEHLAAIATSNGIERFTAEVLADNRAMLSVFARAGWPLQRTYESGVIEVDFPIASTHEYLDSLAEREHRADSRAMARLLLPRSIAVVGTSDRPDTVGSVLWRNITRTANVPVHAVNPNRTSIRTVDRDGVARTDPVWPTVAAIPDDVWLAVVAVPAAALDTTLDDCIAAHVRGAVIVTAVDGEHGAAVDVDGLVSARRREGVRIIGPSSMGVATSHREIGLEAALVPVELSPGSVAIVMQSGSLGASLLGLAQRLDMGLSWFVSLGDRSDVSGNDLLQFWDDDDSTNVIAMYNESLGNTHRFARIARRVSLRRPIVAVRTGAAAIAPSGGALYQHSGLIEVPSVTAMLDTARVLATQPLLRGRRVAVVSNSRSPARLAAAALDVAGLEVAATPVALDWTATSDDYRTAITAAIASDDVDGVLVIHAPPIHDAVGGPVDAIHEAAGDHTKPLVAVLLGSVDGPIRPGSKVPAFSFPEPAAAVLGRSHAYARWLDSEASAAPAAHHDVDVDGVNVVLSAAAIREPRSARRRAERVRARCVRHRGSADAAGPRR